MSPLETRGPLSSQSSKTFQVDQTSPGFDSNTPIMSMSMLAVGLPQAPRKFYRTDHWRCSDTFCILLPSSRTSKSIARARLMTKEPHLCCIFYVSRQPAVQIILPAIRFKRCYQPSVPEADSGQLCSRAFCCCDPRSVPSTLLIII